MLRLSGNEMTKLNAVTQLTANRHTLRDSTKAKKHLNRLLNMLEASKESKQDVTATIKRPIKEVQV